MSENDAYHFVYSIYFFRFNFNILNRILLLMNILSYFTFKK